MLYILIKEQAAINVDSTEERDRLLIEGWRELTPAEIKAAGMEGYEQFVSPVNTTVGEDGGITFTPPAPTPLSEVKVSALSRIDSATSAAILAGFDDEIDTGEGAELLHFSYDAFDQQNFADTANACLLAQSGVEGLPTSITWNAYRNWTQAGGGDLVRLALDVATFLTLYTAGALVHKATQMETGGQRKAAVEAAGTVEEIKALLEEWGI